MKLTPKQREVLIFLSRREALQADYRDSPSYGSLAKRGLVQRRGERFYSITELGRTALEESQ